MKNLFLTLFVFVFLVQCIDREIKGEVYKINFINNSGHKINVHYSKEYPDTTLNETYAINCKFILPHSACQAEADVGWKEIIESNSKNTVIFFVFDVDTLNKYGPIICRKEYKILRRLGYTQLDLERMNWTITYP